MVDRTDPLPVSHQCALLDLPRSTFYHVPQPVTEEELELMALIDRCHLEHPYYGSRRIRDWLEDEGRWVNRKRVQRLMRTMGLAALYPKRNLSLANQAHKVYPYLLRNLVIDHPKVDIQEKATIVPESIQWDASVRAYHWQSHSLRSVQPASIQDEPLEGAVHY